MNKFLRYFRLVLLSLILIIPVLGTPPLLTVIAQSDQLTITTAATGGSDTYLSNANPTTNYGQTITLKVDNAPLQRGLLRFNVTGIPARNSVTNATLRLYANNASPIGGVVSTVLGSWDEASTTWSNAPIVGTAIATLSNPAMAGTWIQANVTSIVTGNGLVNFYITSTNANNVFYNSGENTSNRPTLVITYMPDPILIGAGDIALYGNDNDEKTAQLLDAAFATGDPGKIFAAGDNVYETGTAAEFVNCYNPTWGRHKTRTYPAVGNHEYLTPGASGYFKYFGRLAGFPAKGYYSYNLGAWHIVVLNSNCSVVGGCQVGSPQEIWLRADLTAHPRMCTLAYWHHPRFSSGQHGDFTSVTPIWQTLYDFNADVVLAGHDHDYERFAPQIATGELDLLRGIREFVVGTGGKNHTDFSVIRPNSQIRNADTFGVLKLTLHTASYDWIFIPEEGKTFADSGTQACH